MSTLQIQLPESLLERLQEVTEAEGISINQFIESAVAEKLSVWRTTQASQGSRALYDAALSQVPPVEPEDYDRIPD